MDIKFNKSNLIQLWLILIIVSLTTSPAFALNAAGMNIFLIGLMALSPIVFLSSVHSIGKVDVLLILFLLSIIFAPLLNHPESMRWSTVLYTWIFGITFLAYKQLLYKGFFQIEHFEKLLRYLIYTYTIVLLIQQFCVLTGLPIFIASHYNPVEPWKLSSLAAEPSWSARTVAFLMFCYIVSKEIISKKTYRFKIEFKNDKYLWFSFLWTMTTMNSGTAFLFVFIILSLFLRFKTLFGFIILGLVIFVIINVFGITVLDRTLNVFFATLTFDIESIIAADHSASFRIVPTIVMLQKVSVLTVDDWFGYGIDYTGNFMYLFTYGLSKGTTAGGSLSTWIEYGFLSFALLMLFSLYVSYIKQKRVALIFWFFLVFLYSVNTQILWMALTLLLTINYFYSMERGKL